MKFEVFHDEDLSDMPILSIKGYDWLKIKERNQFKELVDLLNIYCNANCIECKLGIKTYDKISECINNRNVVLIYFDYGDNLVLSVCKNTDTYYNIIRKFVLV